MRKFVIIAALIPVVGYLASHNDSVLALLSTAPVFGLFYAFYRFHKWHRGFHANRRQYGIYRAPGA